MKTSVLVATSACGAFFLVGLLTGVWKWRRMVGAPDHRAPHYVDTAHRAALLYSFACLVVARFAEQSAFADPVNVAAVSLLVVFFAAAIGSYIHLGWVDRTDNAIAERSAGATAAMILLSVSEIGGFLVLLAGFAIAHAGG